MSSFLCTISSIHFLGIFFPLAASLSVAHACTYCFSLFVVDSKIEQERNKIFVPSCLLCINLAAETENESAASRKSPESQT